MSDETFFDLILDCDSESQFELICSSIFENKDYFYTLGEKAPCLDELITLCNSAASNV